MKNEIKSLARDFKNYLRYADEEDFAGQASLMNAAESETNDVRPSAPIAAAQTGEKNSADRRLADLAGEVSSCRKCPLGSTRIKAVFGVGNPHSPVMFIGEGPGYEEDHRGEPFVGRAGQLLDKIIEAMTLTRSSVYITNIAKCHPMINPANPELRSNDRPPSPDEITACLPYLDRQLDIIKPEYIVALGGVASKVLMGSTQSLGALRGKVHDLPSELFGMRHKIKLIATYHPAALLRNPAWKKDTWEDMKMLMRELGMEIPPVEKK